MTAGGEFSGIVAVLVFVMLQQLLFSRMYGKADCHAFSVCALAECGNAVGMVGFLLQMFLSRVIDNRAAVSGKCHSKRQTARTTAVYSLYYHSIFFRNVPRKCF